jgi:hypothetical protein
MQADIDRGLHHCASCDGFGWQTWCGACGTRYVGADLTWRDCPNKECQAKVTTDWCPLCGTRVADAFVKSIEAGTVDWTAEAAMAQDLINRIYKGRPDIAEEMGAEPSGPVDRVAAMNAAFGGKRG